MRIVIFLLIVDIEWVMNICKLCLFYFSLLCLLGYFVWLWYCMRYLSMLFVIEMRKKFRDKECWNIFKLIY